MFGMHIPINPHKTSPFPGALHVAPLRRVRGSGSDCVQTSDPHLITYLFMIKGEGLEYLAD